MKTSTCRLLGGAILGVALVGGIVAPLAGIPLLTLKQSDTHTFPDGSSVTAQDWSIHWLLFVLAFTAAAGVVLLLLPRHEKTNA
jgi:hypothetical protein